MTTATLNQEEQTQIDAIRAQKSKQREVQEQIDRLQRQVDEVQDRVDRAEQTKSFFAQRITQLQQLLLTIWGKDRVLNVDPTSQALDCYTTISTLRAAIEDYPRIKRHLDAELSAAKQRLAQFERQPK
jgi:prefoldin subunit 5